MPERTIERAAKAIAAGRVREPWKELTLGRLRACEAAAYDSAFPKVRRLAALEKRKRLADTRDGGLLALPLDDAAAFVRWYHSRAWSGAHPFEIVFAHPHGILLQPHDEAASGASGAARAGPAWRLLLRVDTEGLYTQVLRMAIALNAMAAPFDLMRAEEVLAAVRGDDEVEVGPDLYSIHYAELIAARPQAARHVRWDPVPRIAPIEPDQKARVARALVPAE